jgi:glycosyltransferase involved in cell wall biosynthesis
MRVLFALPGLHRYDRGAEVAFISVATELAKGRDDVTLIGSGPPRPGTVYRYIQAGAIARERFESWPKMPLLRGETMYEEASFLPGLLRGYRPGDYDVTVTCSYPYTNWALRRPRSGKGRPAHVFVTQNGDWPALSDAAEYRLFGCEGLVCTNPDYFERNQSRWRCALIPNGVDVQRFKPGAGEREAFGLPANAPIVLMVSALIPSKRVADGIRAVSLVPEAHLVVAGDGPLRQAIADLAGELLPGRFTRLTVASDRMPALYRSADIFLHLSLEESFGNVFVEALASGLPVVGHDSARLRWIVGDDEFLLDTTEATDIATMLREALRSPAASKGRRAERAADFAWTKVAQRYRSFFDTLVARSGS